MWIPLSALIVALTNAEQDWKPKPMMVAEVLAEAWLFAPVAGGMNVASGGLSFTWTSTVACAEQWIDPDAPIIAARAEEEINPAPAIAIAAVHHCCFMMPLRAKMPRTGYINMTA